MEIVVPFIMQCQAITILAAACAGWCTLEKVNKSGRGPWGRAKSATYGMDGAHPVLIYLSILTRAWSAASSFVCSVGPGVFVALAAYCWKGAFEGLCVVGRHQK